MPANFGIVILDYAPQINNNTLANVGIIILDYVPRANQKDRYLYAKYGVIILNYAPQSYLSMHAIYGVIKRFITARNILIRVINGFITPQTNYY